jgi:SAM-dependent methyltransferase
MDMPEPEIAALVRESYRIDWHASLACGGAIECPYCQARFERARGLTLYFGQERQAGAFCPDCGSFRYLLLPDAAALAAKYEQPKAALTAAMGAYVIGIGGSLPATLDCLAGMTPVGRSGFASILDVGCGFGLSLLACREALRVPAVGLEPSPAAALGSALLRLPIEQRYLADYRAAEPRRFDLVTANGVVEHVGDPVDLVRQMWEASETAVSFLVPSAEGLSAATPGPRLYGCLAPKSHLTMMSAEGARRLARRLQVPCVEVCPRGELTVVWFSREPLRPASAERLLDLAVDTALACLASPVPEVRDGGLFRLLVLCGEPRYRAWRALLQGHAEALLESAAPGILAGADFDPATLPSFAYVGLFTGAVAAVGRGDAAGCLARLRAARRCIRHLKRAAPLLAAHAVVIEPSIKATIAHLERAA